MHTGRHNQPPRLLPPVCAPNLQVSYLPRMPFNWVLFCTYHQYVLNVDKTSSQGMAYRQRTMGHSLHSRGKLDRVNSALRPNESYEEVHFHLMC